MPIPQLTTSSPEINKFISRFETFLFDCDGVIWSGQEMIPGAADAVRFLQRLGKRIIFVTNNSTESRITQRLRLNASSIAVKESEIFTSAYSAAFYLSEILSVPPGSKVFVLGGAGIETELLSVGFTVIGGTDASFERDITMDDVRAISNSTVLDSGVCAVVVGMDTKFNYLKLCYASHYVRSGALFLATNSDSTFPIMNTVLPAAGFVVGALEAVSNGEKPTNMGKPSLYMLRAIQAKHELDLDRTCMVGDSLNTDMRFGIDARLGGNLLVLTGVTTKQEVDNLDAKNGYRPDAYIVKLSDVMGFHSENL